jgi:hypothetical protein
MDKLLQTALLALFIGFGSCCAASTLLQLVAWSRHKLKDAPMKATAVWKPEGYFDPVGLRQMQLARRLLLIGAVMYLSYGILMFAASTVSLSR